MLNVLKGKRFRNRALTGIVVIAVLLLAGRTFLSAKANTATMDVEGKVVSVMAAETSVNAICSQGISLQPGDQSVCLTAPGCNDRQPQVSMPRGMAAPR